MNRWFSTIVNQPKVKSVLGNVTMCDKATEPGSAGGKKDNKKKEKKEQPKKEAKPKAKEQEEETPGFPVEKAKVRNLY